MGLGTPDLNQGPPGAAREGLAGPGSPGSPVGGRSDFQNRASCSPQPGVALLSPPRPPWTPTQCRGPVPQTHPLCCPGPPGLWGSGSVGSDGPGAPIRTSQPVLGCGTQSGLGQGGAGRAEEAGAGRGEGRCVSGWPLGNGRARVGGSPLHPRDTPIPLHDLDCAAKAFPGLPELRPDLPLLESV